MGAGNVRVCMGAWHTVWLVWLVAWALPGQGFAQTPEAHAFENLKVLPENISEDELHRIMDGFSDALGVSCTHCHVREAGQPPNFASDEKPEKETARVMMRMVQQINGWHLSDLPTVEGQALGVTCMTCHHGLARPQTLDHLLADFLPAHGVDASFAKYDSLRAAYYGTAAYDFSDASLIRLARRLMAGPGASDALAVLRRNLEMYPGSAATHATMAETHLQLGDRTAAIASLERAVALEPGNGRLRRQLEELRKQP